MSEIEGLRAAVHVMRIIPKAANDMMDVARLQGFDVSENLFKCRVRFDCIDVHIYPLFFLELCPTVCLFSLNVAGEDHGSREVVVARTTSSIGIFLKFTE